MSNNKSENIIDPRKIIPNNFGDVMSSRATSLLLPDEFSGLERICLTANGNLQRILRFDIKLSIMLIDNYYYVFKTIFNNILL
jgi:hypothetical protein